MLKLKDVHVGSLVMDTSGIYEITDIDTRTNPPYTVREVIDGETETYGEEFTMSMLDVWMMDLIG